MGRDLEPTTAQGLVPPRPNLGPEPWVEGWDRSWIVGLSILGLAVLLLMAWWWRRARRSRSKRPNLEVEPSQVQEPDHSPRSRLIASAEAVRSAIVVAHGPAWASKTTEELADEPELVERLGADRAARLVELFRVSDRAKFAGEDPEVVEEWEAWAGHLLEEWSAGATSRSIGK
jgi:hypothetical protein